MSFIFNCPHCGERLEAQDDWDGRSAKCPTCNKHIIITKDTNDESELCTSNLEGRVNKKQNTQDTVDNCKDDNTTNATSNVQSDTTINSNNIDLKKYGILLAKLLNIIKIFIRKTVKFIVKKFDLIIIKFMRKIQPNNEGNNIDDNINGLSSIAKQKIETELNDSEYNKQNAISFANVLYSIKNLKKKRKDYMKLKNGILYVLY